MLERILFSFNENPKKTNSILFDPRAKKIKIVILNYDTKNLENLFYTVRYQTAN
jgi:hypothetical protein